ncbi:4'-phosphopantetheinyl transferase [Pseudomonas sp. NCCP-436]|uniref:4'-phosphopantetheinyl transferase family protein n=1 Tax=Pseudomonas sp. NCCP-436 TaxID=2842481 RepID=UPI001C821217|nr:4'-phosphopantetheinyl transferase superfamily protein [Pseudomonas sp. NCCP-436]GIZ13472.1 4'-phosphopantetheinyl transferase [Pseudomonas sp. NCCP-436]
MTEPTPFSPPPCCSAFDDHDRLPKPLAGSHLIGLHFDPLRFTPEDFAHCDISPVPGVAKRQCEYLAGRLCAREALRRLKGYDFVPAVGADRAPQWPPGISGSITHGDNWAAALVAETRHWQAIGLDVERLMGPERAERLQQEILTSEECRRLLELDEAARALRISQTFSLKESLFKALYPLTLTRFYFHDAELLECNNGSARLRLLTDLSPQWRAGRELDGQYSLFDGRVLSLVAVAA